MKFNPGFSTADAGYPSLTSSPGQLHLQFINSQGQPVSVLFQGVPAFHWQEGELPLAAGELYDGAYEIETSELLSQHSEGSTMHSLGNLRHLRFNFNAWGCLEVLCASFTVSA